MKFRIFFFLILANDSFFFGENIISFNDIHIKTCKKNLNNTLPATSDCIYIKFVLEVNVRSEISGRIGEIP